MKLTAAKSAAFIKKPDPAIAIILLFGPDQGLVADRANELTTCFLGENPGPFAQTSLYDAQLKENPGIIADEMFALTLDAGARVIRIKAANDLVGRAISTALAALKTSKASPVARVVIEAGDLSARLSLRKTVESAKHHAVAIGCYPLGPGALKAMAREIAAQDGVSFDPEALDVLASRLPADHALARGEIAKLCLYAGPDSGTTIDPAMVLAVIGDGAEQDYQDYTFAIGMGNAKMADQALHHILADGTAAATLLRALQRHFMRLTEVSAAVHADKSMSAAMGALRPPVFRMNVAAFESQVRRWSPRALHQAIALCLQTERAIKTTGAPAQNLLARLTLQLARAGS